MNSPKKSFHSVQLLIVCAFLTAAATDAVTITWYYEGTVQSVSHNQGGSGDAGDFQPGASFHGSITFDDGATTTSEGIFSRRLTGADLGLTIST